MEKMLEYLGISVDEDGNLRFSRQLRLDVGAFCGSASITDSKVAIGPGGSLTCDDGGNTSISLDASTGVVNCKVLNVD